MLDIQLKESQNALELAFATHQKSIVFIHGIGKGSLKTEIHTRLNQTKWVYKYVNEYNNKYGYGATEVFFRY
jgi:dsDNA-specific endonuclease/ATPase MutS2